MALAEIFVYGTGGHGKVVADIARSCGYTLAGWIDDNPAAAAYTWETFRLSHPSGAIALGIGNNTLREQILDKVSKAGYALPPLIHPSAVISPSATIDEGSVIMPLSVVNAEARICTGCIINSGAVVEHECLLEPFVHISPNAALAGGVRVKHHTHIGIGANCIQNLTVGAHSIIAAGSVLISDIPDYSLAAGVPAKVKKSLFKPI
ncbi:MAG: acetyltransferase [Sulfuricurvum sp.]|uniref:acetyltransferase n=1 Tax=Sulfuricurvum sp. TaxID=2025608 RepID=UPI0025EE37E5|nr:acetyltransferase [Sulfuricurvum sp.]MCK9374079.1 acetyltransferase [Sulfuricurvum sp.]